MKKGILLLLIFFGISSFAEDLRIFSYKLDGFPKKEDNCHFAAMQAGETFALANRGVELISAACLTESNRGYEIEIRYRSEKKVPLVSTTENHIFVLDEEGRFETREACEKHVEAETAIFEEETQLKASFAFCYRTRWSSRKSFALRVDGFGEAKRSPFISGYTIFALPENMEKGEYAKTLIEELAKRDVRVFGIASHSHLAYGQISVHYYAEDKISFESLEYSKVPKTENCEAQRAEAASLLAETDNPPLMLYCARTSVGGVSELTSVYAGAPPVRARLAIEKFESFDACSTARTELLDFYINTLKRPVLTGFCTRNNLREYRVNLLELFTR